MPASVQASFQGTAAAYQAIGSNESLLILAALVAVYIVLGILYESFYSSGHHSLDSPVGGSRRAAGPAPLPSLP